MPTPAKKAFALRLDPALYAAIERLAADELRSANAEIEVLLREALARRLGLRRLQAELRLPPDAGRLRARLHEVDAIRAEAHDEHGWTLDIDLPLTDARRLAAQGDGALLRALLPAD